MIFFLFGDDFKKKNQRLATLIRDFQKKDGDISFGRYNQDNFNISEIESLIQSQGLFEKRFLSVFDNLLSSKELKDLLLNRAGDFSDSENIFIFLETDLDKEISDLFKKEARKVENFILPKIREFNLYSLTDAFGRKDKKKLWALYQKAVLAGFTSEEIQGVLFWQVKNILIVQESKSLSESGLKPFPYQKAKGFSRNFSGEELKKHSEDLISLYHKSHLGQKDFSTGLEKFILNI